MLITEEDFEHMEAVDIQREGSKLERMLRLSEFLSHIELLYDDNTRRLRSLTQQEERQLLYETFGNGQADEIVWSFPVLGYWFGKRRKMALNNEHKLVIFNAKLNRGLRTKESFMQREAKKRFLVKWLAANKADSLNVSREGLNTNLISDDQSKKTFINKHKRLLSQEDEFTIDPDDFLIRKYRKVFEFDGLDGDFSVDHFFIGVRFLDLFLYPVLVFATVNTG